MNSIERGGEALADLTVIAAIPNDPWNDRDQILVRFVTTCKTKICSDGAGIVVKVGGVIKYTLSFIRFVARRKTSASCCSNRAYPKRFGVGDLFISWTEQRCCCEYDVISLTLKIIR